MWLGKFWEERVSDGIEVVDRRGESVPSRVTRSPGTGTYSKLGSTYTERRVSALGSSVSLPVPSGAFPRVQSTHRRATCNAWEPADQCPLHPKGQASMCGDSFGGATMPPELRAGGISLLRLELYLEPQPGLWIRSCGVTGQCGWCRCSHLDEASWRRHWPTLSVRRSR